MPVINTLIAPGGQPLLYFTYQNQFWVLVNDNFLGTGLTMWSSPDGINWTAQGGSQLTAGGVAACYDGAQTVTVWFTPARPLTGTYLQQFDLVAGSWGVPFGNQGLIIPNNAIPAYIAPSGAGFIVVYRVTAFVSFHLYVYAQVWDGSAWGSPIDVSANAEALSGFSGTNVFFSSCTAVLDAAGLLHVIFNTDVSGSAPSWYNRFFYQELSGAGVLQNFQECPGQTGGSNQDIWRMNDQPGAMLFIQGDVIFWGIQRFSYGTDPTPYPSVYLGSPLVNPAWTELGNIDPSNAAHTAGWFPIFQANGGQLYANWLALYATQIRAAITSDAFADFTNATLIDNAATGLPDLFNTGAFIVFGQSLSFATGAVIDEGSIPVYWTGFTTPPPPPPPLFTEPISGGGPPAILCPRPINLYDLCAEDEVRRTKSIDFPKACNIPECLLPWDEDYQPVPAGGVPFNIFGTIETPAAIAGDVLVCSGRVPHGYDGLLTEIYQIYQGSGFQQGSGDIVWRIRRNQIWLKTLGNMPYSLGTPKSPVWLTQGEIMFSGTQFFFFVNVPNLSSMIQVGASTISCGMRGFYWPRG